MTTKHSDKASRTAQQSVSVTGQVSVRGRNESPAKSGQSVVDTGGRVTTGGGAFIGRDQIQTVRACMETLQLIDF
jgi:hypothetical protein